MKKLSVPPGVLSEIDMWISKNQIINAIKALRDEVGATCGLLECKHAIDHRAGRLPREEAAAILGHHFRVKSFTMETHEGEVTVDMEELKLMFLMTMPEIGLHECGELLKLVTFIQEWQGGNGAVRDV